MLMANDLIITNDTRRIECEILELNNDFIKYRPLVNKSSGHNFVIARTDVDNVIFNYSKEEPVTKSEFQQDSAIEMHNEESLPQSSKQIISSSKQNIEVANSITNDIARAENYSGVYVFTDCTPMAKYEILGDISFGGKNGGGSLVVGGGVMFYSSGSELQYTDIRNGLISSAIMANRQVEGVILKLNNSGQGRATMIKFLNNNEDKSLARVNMHNGVLVFMDCIPVSPYQSLGRIRNIGGLDPDYNVLRDKLIRKCIKKFSGTQGVIPVFVSGGNDSGEAITF